MTADADVLLSRLVRTAAARGVAGFDGLAGIPGTVAGAIVNNSGAYGMSTSDQLLSVTVAASGGRLITLAKESDPRLVKIQCRDSGVPLSQQPSSI